MQKHKQITAFEMTTQLPGLSTAVTRLCHHGDMPKIGKQVRNAAPVGRSEVNNVYHKCNILERCFGQIQCPSLHPGVP